MYVIEVIPLKKTATTESLSYYSSVNYPIGTLLSVPIRTKEERAVVISTSPVSAAKTALRTATFSLRKLKNQPDTDSLPFSVIQTAQELSAHIPAHLSTLLFALLPPEVRNGERPYPPTHTYENSEDSRPSILTDITANRFVAYKSQIRQTFAHRGSVLFVVPTSAEIAPIQEQLQHGIEKRVITFSSAHTKKALATSYAALEDLSQAKLIITTPTYAFLDRHDITTIIVEHAGSAHYVTRTRPYLDMRDALKMYAKVTKRSIILGDILPATEDEALRREELYHTYDEHTKRLTLPGELVVVTHPKRETGEQFTLCTDELRDVMGRTLQNRGRVFIYASRRGLAPLVTCFDCGHVFRCPDSGAPYSLLRTYKNGEEERWFYASASGKRERAADTCPSCGSWRLRERGIGIQNVRDTIAKIFPETSIELFDHTTARTYNKAQRIIDRFYALKSGILIGTHMVFPYLHKPIETSAVISYDAMRALPTWRADETILSHLLFLREITQKDVVVQMRDQPDELIGFARKGLIDKFYDEEIAVRSSLSYPPFSVFILLTWSGSKEQTKSIEDQLAQQFKAWDIHTYCAPQSTEEKTVRHGLLRVSRDRYPNEKLVAQLRSLPPYIKIERNPARIV